MNTARFLRYVWPFYNIMHERVKQDDWNETFFYLTLNNKKLTTKYRNYLWWFMITWYSWEKLASSCQEARGHIRYWHNFFISRYINSNIQFYIKQNHHRTLKNFCKGNKRFCHFSFTMYSIVFLFRFLSKWCTRNY